MVHVKHGLIPLIVEIVEDDIWPHLSRRLLPRGPLRAAMEDRRCFAPQNAVAPQRVRGTTREQADRILRPPGQGDLERAVRRILHRVV